MHFCVASAAPPHSSDHLRATELILRTDADTPRNYLPDGITCKPNKDPSIWGVCLRGQCLPFSGCDATLNPPSMPLLTSLSPSLSPPSSSSPLPPSSSPLRSDVLSRMPVVTRPVSSNGDNSGEYLRQLYWSLDWPGTLVIFPEERRGCEARG